MANISDTYGNIDVVKGVYKKYLGLGEAVSGEEFILTFENNDDMTFLVQSSQLPAMIRETIETFGPQGVMFRQQGRYQNAQDVPITFRETIKGHTYEFVRDWVRNKRYLKVKLNLVGESFLEGNTHNFCTMEDCWLELEGVDLSNEDSATMVRPSGTLHANWISWAESESGENGPNFKERVG